MSSRPESPDAADFEQWVADAYRTFGYRVEPNIRLRGQQIDLLATQDVHGAPPLKLAIECKAHTAPLSNQLVQEFVTTISALRAADAINGGVLVSASGFTADARAVAWDVPFVTVLSWEQLTGELIPASWRLREFVSRYEQEAIFREYIAPDVEFLEWDDPSSSQSTSSVDSLLEEWMRGNSSRPRTLVVLADFGAGKTTLLRRIQYDRATAYLVGDDARIPLFVPLREYRDSRDVTTLLRASIRDEYMRDVAPEILWDRITQGGFYLLLDGFDEMAERSTRTHRLELFEGLLPLAQSPCPTALTSRPSFFVERGELEDLLFRIRSQEYSLINPRPIAGDAGASARLRQQLVAQNREVPPRPAGGDSVHRHDLQIARLLPLSPKRLESLIRRWDAELEAAGTSASALMAFISRTYDLRDLATRPLLLKMIIDTALIGGLDITAPSGNFGPSALYEAYTHATLDLDVAKSRMPHEGLPREARRMLAEAVAVEMYTRDSLELGFRDTLETLIRRSEGLRDALAKTELSRDEIATDFATRSFVTLDDRGMCRFVHKSFRGFFVARVLKEVVRRAHPLWQEPLEWEVLYFLGGFAPTQPAVTNQLLDDFRDAPEGTAARRNALTAVIYTSPQLELRVDRAEISDAEFTRIHLSRSRLRDITWRSCTIASLDLTQTRWERVDLESTHIAALTAHSSEIDAQATSVVIDDLKVDGGTVTLTAQASDVTQLSVADALCSMEFESSSVRSLEVHRSTASLRADGGIGSITARSSRLMLDTRGSSKLSAVESVIESYGRLDELSEWKLVDSVVFLATHQSPTDEFESPGPQPRSDSVNVVTGQGRVTSDALAALPFGLFGFVASIPRDLAETPDWPGWGVLSLDADFPPPPPGIAGYHRGRLLLMPPGSYARETSADGRLAPISSLLTVHDDLKQDLTRSTPLPDLPSLLRAMRVAHEELEHAERWLAL